MAKQCDLGEKCRCVQPGETDYRERGTGCLHWKEPKPSVPERLEGLGALYRERNALYGDNYKLFGRIMVGLFPDGVKLQTADDHNRFALYVHILTKATRYAQQFAAGGHLDSMDDLAVYAQMLQEVDSEIANRSD